MNARALGALTIGAMGTLAACAAILGAEPDEEIKFPPAAGRPDGFEEGAADALARDDAASFTCDGGLCAIAIPVLEDTYVTADNPASNFERGPLLVSGNADGSLQAVALLKFDLSVLPDAATLTSASLEIAIQGGSISTPRDLSVRTVASQWDSRTVQWRSFGDAGPTYGAQLGIVRRETQVPGTPISAPLDTDAVTEWAASVGAANGLALVSIGAAAGGELYLHSLETGGLQGQEARLLLSFRP